MCETKNKQDLKIMERGDELEKLGAQTDSIRLAWGFKNTSHFAGFFTTRFSLSILPAKLKANSSREPHIVSSHDRKNSMYTKCV